MTIFNGIKLKYLNDGDPPEIALGLVCLFLYALTFAWSIALTQIFLICFILSILKYLYSSRGALFFDCFQDVNIRYIFLPLFCWFLITIISSFFGLGVFHSLVNLLKFSIYFVIPFFVLILFRHFDARVKLILNTLLVLFVVSHGIAGIHTFISSCIGYEIKPRLPGPLTESGQLELLFPVIFILPYLFEKRDKFLEYSIRIVLFTSFLLVFAIMMPRSICIMGLPLAIIAAFIEFKLKRVSLVESILLVCIPFSLSALVLGLKRGPWLSICIELLVLFLLFKGRRYLWGLLLLLPLGLIDVLRERVFSFSEHFFIGGGRFDMWKLGLTLIERFPLGLGFANSDLIRRFDESLPLMHRHMHNNLLNIILECGWIGAVFFFIWIYRIIKISWPLRSHIGAAVSDLSAWSYLRGAIALSMIGWQIGGLVEYNIGDGEIRLFALVLLGIYLFSLEKTSKSTE